MTESLVLIPENVNAALLIRHSVHYPIPPGDHGTCVPLTSEEWEKQKFFYGSPDGE